MGVIASQITSLTIVFLTVYSDADQRKHQSSASLVFGINGQLRGKMFPFDYVIIVHSEERTAIKDTGNNNLNCIELIDKQLSHICILRKSRDSVYGVLKMKQLFRSETISEEW